jgi:hypothetical protein
MTAIATVVPPFDDRSPTVIDRSSTDRETVEGHRHHS